MQSKAWRAAPPEGLGLGRGAHGGRLIAPGRLGASTLDLLPAMFVAMRARSRIARHRRRSFAKASGASAPVMARTTTPSAAKPRAGLDPARSFQDLILTLQQFWAQQGCVILQPYDMEVGAGTFHPATTLRALGPKRWNAAYVQPSRRPKDGRYGENPNRLQHYYQFQVILKPSPPDILDVYLQSLAAIGIDTSINDIRLVEDDWESPTLGAWGLGWEVWCNGMEITQFTYFQQVGGFDCRPVSGELTYGLERLAMYVQGVENVYDLDFNGRGFTYGDVFLQAEREYSAFNFEVADTEILFRHFEDAERHCRLILDRKLA